MGGRWTYLEAERAGELRTITLLGKRIRHDVGAHETRPVLDTWIIATTNEAGDRSRSLCRTYMLCEDEDHYGCRERYTGLATLGMSENENDDHEMDRSPHRSLHRWKAPVKSVEAVGDRHLSDARAAQARSMGEIIGVQGR